MTVTNIENRTNTQLVAEKSEPEIVIAEAVPQDEVPPFTPTPCHQQQQQNETSFDILCCGDDTRQGVRVRPGRNFVIKLCGNANIVLPKDPPAGSHYKFIIMNLCGDTRFLVPKGAMVVLRRIALCGNRSIEPENEEISASSIRITVTIIQLCGDVRMTSIESPE